MWLSLLPKAPSSRGVSSKLQTITAVAFMHPDLTGALSGAYALALSTKHVGAWALHRQPQHTGNGSVWRRAYSRCYERLYLKA